MFRAGGDAVGAAGVGVGGGLAHGLVPFVSEAARCFLPVGETRVCKRKGASRGTETKLTASEISSSFWAEAPWSAPRGWPLSPAKQGLAASAASCALARGAVTRRACAVVARRRKECSKGRSLLAELLPTQLTGAGYELAETPKGERKHSMPGYHPKLGAAARRLGVGQGVHGESWIACNRPVSPALLR